MDADLASSTDHADDDKAVVPRARRRLPMALVTGAFVVLVLVIVVVLLILKVTRGSTTVQPPPVTPAPADAVQAATSVPASAFDAAGTPAVQNPAPSVLSGQPQLVVNGRPDVVFVGAEFCPYCAAERWALVVALGRFGTFAHLGATSSSEYEAFPGTPTFSFDGSTYRSRYVSFTAAEEYGQAPSTLAPAGFHPLENLTPFETTLLNRYDSAQFSSEPGVLPFVDVDNRLIVTGASIGFSPGVLEGSSMGQIASQLSDPTTSVGRAVLGAANELAAAICSATNQSPHVVCASKGVQAAADELGLGGG